MNVPQPAFEQQEQSEERTKEDCEVLLRQKAALQVLVQEGTASLAALSEQLQAATVLAQQWEKKAERSVSNAKYDQIAREGQTKKLIIAEHELASCKHDAARLHAQYELMEGKAEALRRAWLDERALRLQDLHRHDALAMASEAVKADAAAAVATHDAALTETHALRSALQKLETELAARRRVQVELEHEGNDQASDAEALQHQLMALRRALLLERSRSGDGSACKMRIGARRHRSHGKGAADRSSRSKSGDDGGAANCSKLLASVGSLRSNTLLLRADDSLATLVVGARTPPRVQLRSPPFATSAILGSAAGSSLSVPGSLFVSNGLGIKKVTVDVGRGSAKEALRAALALMQ